MKDPMVLKRINFPYSTLKDIDTFKTEERIESEAEAVRQLTRLGLLTHNLKHKIHDESFLSEIKQLTQADKMFDYLETLPITKLSALLDAVQLVRENKYKQEKLI